MGGGGMMAIERNRKLMKLQIREQTMKVARITSYDKGLPGMALARQPCFACAPADIQSGTAAIGAQHGFHHPVMSLGYALGEFCLPDSGALDRLRAASERTGISFVIEQ